MAVLNTRTGGSDGYSEEAQIAKWEEGFKKGPFYSQPNLSPPNTFVDGLDPLVREARQEGKTMGTTCTDPHKV